MVYESLQYLNIVIVHILDVLKQMYLQLKLAQKLILVYYTQCSLIICRGTQMSTT